MDERLEVVSRHTGPQWPSSVDAVGALKQIVASAHECFVVHSEESTKRARLTAYETTEVARIKAAEGVLKYYFDHAFAERRDTVDELFARLDASIEADNAVAVRDVVQGIVDIAKSSPLADLGDLGEIRKALDDPNQVWDL